VSNREALFTYYRFSTVFSRVSSSVISNQFHKAHIDANTAIKCLKIKSRI
jgi:hypothetical protein